MIRRIIAVGVTVLGAENAPAQERADTVRRDSTQVLSPVTVTRSRAAGAAGGAAVVDLRVPELRSSPAPLLDQALREAPFVLVRQNSRGEMEISVRGSDSRQAAVLYNGLPLTLGWDSRTDPSLIPITGADHLVIVRGLGSLLNGPNTLGGTIEVTHGAQPVGQRYTAGLGLDQTGARVLSAGLSWGSAAGRGAQWSLSAGVSNRSRDGFIVPGGAGDSTAVDDLRTNTDLDHTDAFAALRWSGRSGRAVGLTLSGFRAERGVAPEEHIRSPRLWRYPYTNRRMAVLSASSGVGSTPLGTGSLEVSLGWNAGRLRIESFRDRTFATVTGSELGEERTMTGRLLATHSVGPATLRASLTGADARYTETLPPAAAVDYRQVLVSGATELDVPLGSRTTVSGGVAFDKSSTPETGGRTPGQAPLDNGGWRLGVTHVLRPGIRVHASSSMRSRFPALRELYSGALNRFAPNPALRPETLTGFETGVTLAGMLGPRTSGTLQLIGFAHEMDDAIVRITLPAPDRRFRRVNRDRIESRGLELLGGLTIGDGDRAVSLSGDAMLQRFAIFDESTIAQLSRNPENNPERRATLDVGVPLGLGVRLTGTARYTGTQYCLNPDTARELRLGSATRQDYALERTFAVGRGVFSALRALLALDNATDATVYDQCGLPQPGRTLRLMFTLR